MVELLNEVDTTGVAVTTTMADRKNVLRADVALQGESREELFKMYLNLKIIISRYQQF